VRAGLEGGVGVAALLVACAGVHGHAGPGNAGAKAPETDPSARLSVAEIADRARPSVVVIRTEAALATGFVVAPNVVVTNLHVLANAGSAELLFADGTRSMVTGVLDFDAAHDLAMLAMAESTPAHAVLALGDDRRLRAGDAVVALGTPQGLDFIVSTGVIGAVRTVNADLTLLQITAPISPGSSGGPLLNESGAVVGVTTLMLVNGQNLNFAVPSRYVQALLSRPHTARPLTKQTTPKRTPQKFGNAPLTEKPYPDAVAGFKLGMTLRDAKKTCPGTLVEKKNYLECSVAAVPVPFASGPVRLFFSTGRLISVKLVATSAEDARTTLTSRYGPPHDPRIAFDKSGGAQPPKAPLDKTVHLEWSFADGGSINIDELSPRRVEVLYTAPVWNDEGNY